MNYFLKLTSFALLAFIMTHDIQGQATNVGDSLALVDFYNSTGGDNWTTKTGWKTGPVRTWYGVQVSNGRVIILSLPANELTGIIPSSIGNLTELQTLGLASYAGPTNQIGGSIPTQIGNLKKLTLLNLFHNKLTGTIPSSLGSLSSLEYLSLEENNLSGTISPSIGNLSNLQILRLGLNNLTGEIPGSFGGLINLQLLELQKNQLSGQLPASLSNLTKLGQLYLFENKLSGSPEQALRNLKNLGRIFMTDNQFTDTLPSFSGFTNLTEPSNVLIGNNSFTYTSIEKLAELFGPQAARYWGPQKDIRLTVNDSMISTSAGGTLSNNTYWWLDGAAYTVIKGDSTFFPAKTGQYSVQVFNSKVESAYLSLKSDTIEYFKKCKIIDPNPSLVTSSGNLSTNLQLLDTTKLVLGTVADGTSKLIIYTNSSIGLKFSLSDPNNGYLSSLNSPNRETMVTIFPSNGKIALVYTPPDGMGNDSRPRTVTIKMCLAFTMSDFGKVTKDITFTLYSAPILLVHGMWSDPDAWIKDGFFNYLLQNGFERPYRANYKDNNFRTFNPNSPESVPGRKAIESEISDALDYYRFVLKVACAQVDIVAHSLGGLMARSYSQQPLFKANSNFYKGTIHKLITLGTPHRGSPFGPELIKNQDSTVKLPSLSPPYYYISTVGKVLEGMGQRIGSCHIDFGIESNGIKALKQTEPFKTFAISGDATGQTTGITSLDALCRWAFKKSFDQLMARRTPCVGSPLLNDLIVPLNSQKGFAPGAGGKDTVLLNLCHSVPGRNTMLNSSEVMDKVKRLLLSNDPTEFSSGFPVATSIPLDCNSASQRQVEQQDSIKHSPQNSRLSSGQPTIKITAPAAGSVYQEGSNAIITLSIVGQNGAKPVSGLLMVGHIDWYPLPSTAPYSVNFTLPVNTDIGKISILALAVDSSGVSMADTAHIIIQPNGTLDSLSVDPRQLVLDSSMRAASILVEGYFKSGNILKVHDLTDSSTGTKYMAITNSVFTVNGNGYVTAKTPGTDTLLISNNGKAVKIPIIVAANFQQSKLSENIISFPTISDRIIGDDPFGLAASASSGDDVKFSLISGQSSIVNDVLTMDAPGKITISASQDGNVYFAKAQDVQQTFCVNPVKPTISINGSVFTSTATIGNQWYFDGVPVNGATLQSITAIQSGVYQVQVETADGCKSKLSDSINHRVTAVITPQWDNEVLVFPNPTTGLLIIKNNAARILILEILDETGRLVQKDLVISQNRTLNIKSFAAGNYIVRLTDQKSKEVIHRKILKLD